MGFVREAEEIGRTQYWRLRCPSCDSQWSIGLRQHLRNRSTGILRIHLSNRKQGRHRNDSGACPRTLVFLLTSVQEIPQLARTALVVLQLAQRLVLNLTDALARDTEVAADFLERVLAPVYQALAQLEHHRFTVIQLAKRFLEFLTQDDAAGLLDR